jgi:crotonobetainyl-CoA:carnitine CoA-transferase CaiB-like acyl-CoA transferase
MGNRDVLRAPQGLYACRGGATIAISVGESDWERFVEVIGAPGLRDDPRLSTLAGRRAHHDEVDEAVADWAADRDAYDAFHALQRAGVPAGPLLGDTAFYADPHLAAREWLRPLTTTDVGTHVHPGLPYRGVPQAWRRGSPGLGEDNDYVFKTLLGVSHADYERYRHERITAEDYLTPDGEPY